MSLDGLLTKTFVLYRWTKSTTYPHTEFTWASAGTIPCYVSIAKKSTLNDSGALVRFTEARFRTNPYSYTKGDRIYYNSHVYDTSGGYEDIDELGREAVTIGVQMDDSVKTDMGIV